MLSKNKIKYIHSLEQKKTRKEEQVFLAEGPKLVGDLLGHFPCRFLAATSFWLQEHPGIQASEIAEVSQEELSRIRYFSGWKEHVRTAIVRQRADCNGK